MPTRYEQLEKLHAADPADADITYMIAMEHTKLNGPNGRDHQAVIDWLATLKLGIEKANAAGDAKAVSELSELMATME